jgi:hypothetical protein
MESLNITRWGVLAETARSALTAGSTRLRWPSSHLRMYVELFCLFFYFRNFQSAHCLDHERPGIRRRCAGSALDLHNAPHNADGEPDNLAGYYSQVPPVFCLVCIDLIVIWKGPHRSVECDSVAPDETTSLVQPR